MCCPVFMMWCKTASMVALIEVLVRLDLEDLYLAWKFDSKFRTRRVTWILENKSSRLCSTTLGLLGGLPIFQLFGSGSLRVNNYLFTRALFYPDHANTRQSTCHILVCLSLSL